MGGQLVFDWDSGRESSSDESDQGDVDQASVATNCGTEPSIDGLYAEYDAAELEDEVRRAAARQRRLRRKDIGIQAGQGELVPQEDIDPEIGRDWVIVDVEAHDGDICSELPEAPRRGGEVARDEDSVQHMTVHPPTAVRAQGREVCCLITAN